MSSNLFKPIIKKMPQLDSLTFFNQLFWVLTIFFIFYSVSVSTVLPVLSRILKTRFKKLAFAKTDSELANEKDLLFSKIDSSFFNSFNSVKSVLSKVKLGFTSYQDTVKIEQNNISYHKANEKYVSSLVSVILKKNILN